MRKLILACLCMLSFPAFADTPKPMPKEQDLMKQETVALGDNRFLIFSGTATGNGQYGYSIDLVKIDNGIPHFDPLFIEEYNPDTNKAKLEYGIAFLALSYHFDKAANTLSWTMLDEEAHSRLQLTYRLDTDIFFLEQVISQKTGPCPKEPCVPSPPKVIYKATAHAKAH